MVVNIIIWIFDWVLLIKQISLWLENDSKTAVFIQKNAKFRHISMREIFLKVYYRSFWSRSRSWDNLKVSWGHFLYLTYFKFPANRYLMCRNVLYLNFFEMLTRWIPTRDEIIEKKLFCIQAKNFYQKFSHLHISNIVLNYAFSNFYLAKLFEVDILNVI